MNKNVEINPTIQSPVDKKSKQVINKELLIAQLGYTKLKGAEPYNEATANLLVEKHLKKKSKFAPVLFLVDRIRFTKKGTHEFLNYREIEHMHRFPSHPNVFMLYVIEEKRGKRSYETYCCNNATDVQTVRDIISIAQSDPKRLVHSVGPTRLISISSSSSSEYFIETAPPRKSYAAHQSIQYVQQEPTQYMVQREPQVVYQKAQPGSNDWRASAPAGSITYLKSDNIEGPQIMDRGPIYMYSSRSLSSLVEEKNAPVYVRQTYY